MKAGGLVCKRLRYFLLFRELSMWRKKKAALVRKMKGMPPNAVWLFEDETVLRLLPEIRRAWSLRGEQARIRITGKNANCVLFGALQSANRPSNRGAGAQPCGRSISSGFFASYVDLTPGARSG